MAEDKGGERMNNGDLRSVHWPQFKPRNRGMGDGWFFTGRTGGKRGGRDCRGVVKQFGGCFGVYDGV